MWTFWSENKNNRLRTVSLSTLCFLKLELQNVYISLCFFFSCSRHVRDAVAMKKKSHHWGVCFSGEGHWVCDLTFPLRPTMWILEFSGSGEKWNDFFFFLMLSYFIYLEWPKLVLRALVCHSSFVDTCWTNSLKEHTYTLTCAHWARS